MSQLIYTPPGSLRPFVVSDKFINLVVGPVGSTKTTAGLMKIPYEAGRVAACEDKIRRSRVCVIRNTKQQLDDTTIPDFLKFFPDGVAGEYQKSERKFQLRFDDVECEILFRGLDDSDDVRRLLALQLSFGVMDEFREIHQDIFDALQGRLGRYPDGMLVPHRPEWGVDNKGNPIQGCVADNGVNVDKLWGMSNPPDLDTQWETYLTDPPENAAVFLQPSGLAPEADWLHYLKANYYENLMEGKTQAWIDNYIHAKFGKSLSGQPVFPEFNRAHHVAAQTLIPQATTAQGLIIGIDCGLNPAAVIGQMSYDGRVLIYDVLTASGMGALRFVREKLKPLLAIRFAGMASICVIDPAGNQRAQTDERTVSDILKAEGLSVKPAKTNNIVARVAAVDNLLTRLVDGKHIMVIDPGCVPLIRALQGKYRYKINLKGEQSVEPEKSHPWSDIADAYEYLCLHADGGNVFGASQQDARREIQPAPFRTV